MGKKSPTFGNGMSNGMSNVMSNVMGNGTIVVGNVFMGFYR